MNTQHKIKEGKLALTWTRLSCAKYVSNQVRLALFVLAYNLGNFMRRFALPIEVSHWSLARWRERGEQQATIPERPDLW